MKTKSTMKVVAVVFAATLLFASCGGGDNVARIKGSSVMYDGKTVGNGKLTWGKLADFMMEDPQWEGFKGTDGKDYVNLSGCFKFIADGEEISLGDDTITTIQFLINNKDFFSINATEFSDGNESYAAPDVITNFILLASFVGMGYKEYASEVFEIMNSGALTDALLEMGLGF